jgi:putative hydrolase of the HAD superfamily
MTKENLFLDYGELIVNYDFNKRTLFRAHNLALTHLNSSGFDINLEGISAAHDRAIKAYLQARHDSTEWSMNQIMELMLQNLGINSPALTSQIATIYKLNDHDITPKGNSPEILADLAQRRKLGIISNLPHDSLIYELQNYGMRDLFDLIVISYQVGFRKPHPAIYKEAIRRASTTPEKCIFVSHDEQEVKGAEAVGIRGILVKSLEEVIGIL